MRGPRATLTEHPDTIAGSATCLYDCMRRAVCEMGVPLESAVRAATENPARSIGVDADYGSLAAGRYGNVVLAKVSTITAELVENPGACQKASGFFVLLPVRRCCGFSAQCFLYKKRYRLYNG